MNTAWWTDPDVAGTFLGQHAIFFLFLVLTGVFGVALFFWRFAVTDRQRFDDRPPLSHFRNHFLRAWTTVTRRFSPEVYLGLHLTITLIVLLGGTVAIFLGIAGSLGSQNWLMHFDRSFSVSLHEHSDVRAGRIFALITNLGNASILTSIALVALVALAVKRRWQLLLVWTVALLGVGLMDELLKDAFRRIRPQLPHPWIIETGWSFPSGHAMGSLVAYGMLAYSLGLVITSHSLRICITFLTICLVIAIGFSRIYLGVHYFSDVIAGYLAASFYLSLCIFWNETGRRRKPKNIEGPRNR